MPELGFVVGRFAVALSKTPAGGGTPPLYALNGQVEFRPINVGPLYTDSDPVTISEEPVTVDLDNHGYIKNPAQGMPNGSRGVLVPVGHYWVYVRSQYRNAVTPFPIEVLPTHTQADPLDLTLKQPYKPATGNALVEDRIRAEAAARETAGAGEWIRDIFMGGSDAVTDAAVETYLKTPGSNSNEALGYELSTPGTPATNAVVATLTAGVRPELYGAKGDGQTNDTAAFAALLADGHADIQLGSVVGYLIDADVLDIPEGGSLKGVSAAKSKLIIRSDSGNAGVYAAPYSTITDVSIYPENYEAVGERQVNYPEDTGNVRIGLYMEDEGVSATRVVAAGFSESSINAGANNSLYDCYVQSSPSGYTLRPGRGTMIGCGAKFCHNYGADAPTLSTPWRFIGNRFEWNARVGLRSGAEATMVGNVFDRNGRAGLWLHNDRWGQSVVGNHFSRNGAGGNGTVGRWADSVPGHESYLETTAEQSCHIMINGQRSTSLTGNRYSKGYDDSNGGVESPAYIYSSETSSSRELVSRAGNVGEFGTPGLIGYSTSSYSKNGIAGGTDPELIVSMTRPFDQNVGVATGGQVRSAGLSPSREQSNNTSQPYDILVDANRSGILLVSWRASASSGLTRIYWGCDTNGANKQVVVDNVVGSAVASATIAGAGGGQDRITLTASGGLRTYNYLVQYTSHRA